MQQKQLKEYSSLCFFYLMKAKVEMRLQTVTGDAPKVP